MRARWILPVLLTAALAVTGCGGDAGSGGAQAGSDTSPGPDGGADPDADGGEEPADDGASRTPPAEVPETLRFTGTTVDGEPFDAATLTGQPTVLWFWAPWCPKCLAQGPETANVAAEFEGRAHVIGVAGLDSADAMRGFVDQAGVGGFTNLSDEAGEIWRKFEITEQSVYVLLDQDGEQVFTGNLPAGDGLGEKVGELLG
jgi:thiol-disulfide isomerase/thioredoxin